MPTPHSLLRLMWLASPALPVGGFSYSEGLEPAVESGRVTTETQAADWLADQLHLAIGRADLPVMVAAMRAWRAQDTDTGADDITRLNDWMHATRESAEFRLQTEQMGRSLLEWLRQGTEAADARIARLAALAPTPTWPIAFALAAVQADAEPGDAALAFCFGWAENMVQAAMKAVPLGQVAAQRILGRLTVAIPPVVAAALEPSAPPPQAFTPMLAILSAQHEHQYSRLFRS